MCHKLPVNNFESNKKKSNFDESFINIIMMIVINDTYLR